MAETSHTDDKSSAHSDRKRVVIIGSGFGGLFAAKRLRRTDVDVTLISETPYHLFQPLLYQVATGILSEGLIAPTTRAITKRYRNLEVILSHVERIDVERQEVISETDGFQIVTAYDWLIVAAGAQQSYFGHDEFAEFAPGLKTIPDALDLRERIFGAFERAEATEPDEDVAVDDLRRGRQWCHRGRGCRTDQRAGAQSTQRKLSAHRSCPRQDCGRRCRRWGAGKLR